MFLHPCGVMTIVLLQYSGLEHMHPVDRRHFCRSRAMLMMTSSASLVAGTHAAHGKGLDHAESFMHINGPIVGSHEGLKTPSYRTTVGGEYS